MNAHTPIADDTRPSVGQIIQIVADVFGETIANLTSEKKDKETCRARFAVCFVAKEFDYSFPEIGRELGRCHTSVIHGCERARQYIRDHQAYRISMRRVLQRCEEAKAPMPIFKSVRARREY